MVLSARGPGHVRYPQVLRRVPDASGSLFRHEPTGRLGQDHGRTTCPAQDVATISSPAEFRRLFSADGYRAGALCYAKTRSYSLTSSFSLAILFCGIR